MAKSKRIRILVADDHYAVRSGLVASLGIEDDLEMVGEAENGVQAVEIFRKTGGASPQAETISMVWGDKREASPGCGWRGG